jgi:putative transcriptional regulator
MSAKKFRSPALAAIHETATDLRRAGGLDAGTMREFDALCLTPFQTMIAEKAPTLRAFKP